MKPIILIFSAYYLPGFRGGGPIRTIANVVEQLSDDFEFLIVTRDRDLGDQNSYESIKINSWNQVGKAKVYYLSKSSESLLNIYKLIRNTPHNIIYLNSFFDLKFTWIPYIANRLQTRPHPTILAPRGEFSEGAFKIKRWKKAPFVILARWMGICKDTLWHASTSYESADIISIMKVDKSNIHEARNVTMMPDSSSNKSALRINEGLHFSKNSGLRVCFLSRISPKKNLDYAIKVLAHVKAIVHFNIYGPKEHSTYWDECEALIKKLPSNIFVNYKGSIENSLVREMIATHDIFFVPSRGENFGHVFMESLSAGVPILVSDQTPWRNLKELKLGWDIPLEHPEKFVAALEEAAGYDTDAREDISMRCINFARKKSDDIHSLEMNRNLFQKALSLINSSQNPEHEQSNV